MTTPSATRVAIYTRVSTDMQASKDEGSLDTQEARLRAAVASRAGCAEVVRVFREEGESGKSLDRPELQALLAGIRAGDFDLLMVTRIDRLSRSLMDFHQVHELMKRQGVQFWSLNESFDTSTAVGRAMLKLVLVFAELEREQTAERTRHALEARAQRGLWNGGHPPLGYESEGSGHLTVNAAEAELVRLIFARYLELRSTNKLARWLNEQGHRQKRYTSRRRGETGGKPFSVAVVRGMLKNRLYLGEIEHKGQVFEGQHDAVIDQDSFDRAQEVMEGNTKQRRGPPLRTQYDYLLTGIVRCACGYALTTSAGNGRGGRYHYYRCVGVGKKTEHRCEVKQVRAERADQAVLDIVSEAAKEPRLLAEAVEEANRMAREQVSPLQERVAGLRRELGEAEKLADQTLTSILSAGVGASVTAKRVLLDAETRVEQLREALARTEGELATRETEQLDLEVMVEAIRSFDVAFEHLTLSEKREFLQLMVKQVEVHKDHVVVDLYEGRQAIRFLDLTRRGVPGVPSAVPTSEGDREQGSQTYETPGGDPGFVNESGWLPGLVGRGNMGGEGGLSPGRAM